MGCPHGSGPASQCSQCLGVAARRVVKVGEGIFAVGTQVIRRPTLVQDANYGTVYNVNTRPRCTYCRKVGHLEANCRDKFNSEQLAAAILGSSTVQVTNGNGHSKKKVG